MNTPHTLLLRQIRRSFGLDSIEAMKQHIAAAPVADEVARADLDARLQRLCDMVSSSYGQFDRDLELRSRSLELSSQELTQANDRLRAEAATQKLVLDTLRASTRDLLQDLKLPESAAGGDSLLALATEMRELLLQREESHREIARGRAMFQSAIEALDVGFVMFDEHDRIVVCNSKFREVTPLPGLPGHATHREFVQALYRSDVPGIDRSLSEDEYVQHREALHRALAQGPRMREAGGDGRWYRLDESRSPEGLTVSLRTDITESKRLVQEMRAAKDAAEEASRAKTRFLANMSHELRTPLNAVIGAAQLLAGGGAGGDSQAHLVEAIQKSGINLLGLIENILDLSCIEADELELVREDFHLLDCVDAALATASVGARAKGLTLSCIVAPDLAAWRRGDALRLRQVLLNLLGNAVKFTAAGEIVLRIVGDGSDDGLHISVTDTGVGIGEASLPQIFEPFRQADDGSTRRFGGSGLGLSIVRRLLQAMGGDIRVRSQLGQGTRFDIDLPLPLANEVPAPAAPLDVPIAFYEPDESSASALAAQLSRLGCPAQRVHDGQSLRQWLEQQDRRARNPWVLVACDGAAFWPLLEDAGDLIDPERVLGMTSAEVFGLDVANRGHRLPRNIIKPVLRSALVSRLGVIRRAESAAPMTVPAQLQALERGARLHRVLVVEDDPLNQTIVCRMLSHAGCEVTAASDGAQALALLSEQTFDLVLMDWQMPDMDGLEVTRCIRAGRAGAAAQGLPIVALTANAFAEDRLACLAAGMNDFLTKPVLSDLLLSAVRRWCARAVSPQPDPMPVDPMTLVVEAPVDFDASVLAALPMVADGSDPGYADELLDAFTLSARGACDDIQACFDRGDTAQLQRRVHTLKSTAAQVGALALAAEAGAQEAAQRRGAAPEATGAGRLRRRLAAFEQMLAAHRDDIDGRGATPPPRT